MKIGSTIQILALGMIVFPFSIHAETHWELQAVYSDGTLAGYSKYWKVGADFGDSNNKVVITGIVLNNPEDILDTQANYNMIPGDIGGQWQIYVQGLDGDHAGTAVWIGQNYENRPPSGGVGRYTNEEWVAELNRINFSNGHQIRQGDLVRVTGFALQYNGKSNINERHKKHPDIDTDFTVEWLEQTPGLPEAEVITLADIKDSEDKEIFDGTRNIGCEYYQSRLVRINSVHIVSGTFAPDSDSVYIGDDTGRTLRLKLGLGETFNTNNLNSTFDVIGIFDQEYGYVDGYRLWVTGYNGGQTILGIEPPVRGDANGDRMVNVGDLGILAANYGRNLKVEGVDSPLWRSYGDFNGDGVVNVGDLGILAANYGAESSYSADYAKVFVAQSESDNTSEETTADAICSGLGLPLILMLGMMGLMLMKLEE
ncbi:MAG: hypothetical protein GX629_02560 [Phycisphaerae bacterium]|nr:hypothetical protein [Phycisphaerae bacterium]